MKLVDFYSKNKISFNNDLTLYVCGPTVYSDPHIGNMRPIIIFDILNRVFSLNGNVNFVHNITDVDDKIIAKAKKLNISETEISNKYTQKYLDLLKKLNIKMPNHMPKVTENIDGIIEFINKLIEKKFAYVSNGSVYFSVDGYKNYGKLLQTDLSQFDDFEKNLEKKNNQDFALWKKTSEGIKWKSPWSEGRPGWHTECAFFIEKYFGNNGVDVHGGGIDLKFPHHINEMAQYETCCSLNNTAKVWRYIGHVDFENEKMSKSLGNTILAKDFIDKYGSDVLRMLMIQTSPLNPINANSNSISNSIKLVEKIKNSLIKSMLNLAKNFNYELNTSNPSKEFIEILEDDLNITNGITFILDQVKIINSNIIVEAFSQ